MSVLKKYKPVILTSLAVWLLYALFAALQETYHEVVCEGGFDTGDIFIFILFMFISISLWTSPAILVHFVLGLGKQK